MRNWMFVAHVCDLPKAGDYQCFEMADERAVVVRDQQGEIRAFHNMCRHRASRVVAEDKGHCGHSFICPFHGWSYNLDGSLKNIPKSSAFPEIEKSDFGLKPLDCEIWHGMIFIRFGGDGASIAELFAEAAEEIGLYQIEDMQPLDEPYQYRLNSTGRRCSISITRVTTCPLAIPNCSTWWVQPTPISPWRAA